MTSRTSHSAGDLAVKNGKAGPGIAGRQIGGDDLRCFQRQVQIRQVLVEMVRNLQYSHTGRLPASAHAPVSV